MDTHTPPSGDDEVRKDYSDADRKKMAKSGHAMPDGSYPIANTEDLQNAIHAVGRGGSSHDAIRKHIIARADALGASHMIPDNWNSDGSLKQANSRKTRKPRHRAVPLTREVRCLQARGLEVRDAGGSGDSVTVTGLPIVYNTPYTVVDAFGEFEERMVPGVADATLANADVRFLIDHDPSRLLARTASGTLRLTDSTEGLRMQATLDLRDTDAQNLMVRIERGDVSQMSCGFIVARDEWNDDMDQRTIQKFADLLDVSAVTYPASPTTSIEVAQRMAMRMEVESRARLRKFTADLRAGKKISAANHTLIASAIDTLNSVIDGAVNPTDDAILDGDGAPDDDGKGIVLPEEPTASMELDEDGDSDGLAGEPLNDPGEQIRTSAALLAEVAARRGHRGTQAYRAEKELHRQVKLRIVK